MRAHWNELPNDWSDDEKLAGDFLAGWPEEIDGRIVHKYFEPGSDEEKAAQAALLRVLWDQRKPLNWALRVRIADCSIRHINSRRANLLSKIGQARSGALPKLKSLRLLKGGGQEVAPSRMQSQTQQTSLHIQQALFGAYAGGRKLSRSYCQIRPRFDMSD